MICVIAIGDVVEIEIGEGMIGTTPLANGGLPTILKKGGGDCPKESSVFLFFSS